MKNNYEKNELRKKNTFEKVCKYDFILRILILNWEHAYYIYITKFSLSLITQHPDFASNAFIMDVLSSGSYDVVTETGMPALILSSLLSSALTYPNQSYTFIRIYATDVYYLTDSQSLSVIEKTSTQVLPDLSCSLSSSTSIVFSLGSYNNVNAPSWITVDANTGLLTIP